MPLQTKWARVGKSGGRGVGVVERIGSGNKCEQALLTRPLLQNFIQIQMIEAAISDTIAISLNSFNIPKTLISNMLTNKIILLLAS